MKLLARNHLLQSGQTLVETVVGIFILAVGISTAVGLAVKIFAATGGAVKQIIGAGLAREGLEIFVNARDTNWLKGALSEDCYNYHNDPATMDARCQHLWLNPGTPGTYNLAAGLGACYLVDFQPDQPGSPWVISQQTSCTAASRLYYDSSASRGYYTINSTVAPSEYFRQVYLLEETSPSYYQPSIGPRLKIVSRVWWHDKGCPEATVWDDTKPKCRIELTTYLTNWRNY